METNFLFSDEKEDELLEALKGHLVGDPLEIRKKLRDSRLLDDAEGEQITSSELAAYGLELLRLLGACECRLLALRSHVLLAVLNRSEDSLSEIARNFQVCRATTSHIARKFKKSLSLQIAGTTRGEAYSEQCRHRAVRVD